MNKKWIPHAAIGLLGLVAYLLSGSGWVVAIAAIALLATWLWPKFWPKIVPKAKAAAGTITPQIKMAAGQAKSLLGWIDLIWLAAFLGWFFTAQAWPWYVAIIVRVWWWWTRQKGNNILPVSVRQSMSSGDGGNAGNSGLLFAVKFIVAIAVIVALAAVAAISLLVTIPAAIVWLRKPAKPVKESDGTLRLPIPWLFSFIPPKPRAWIQSENEIGSDGVRIGVKFFIDKRCNFPATSVATVNVTDTLLGWLTGGTSVQVMFKQMETAEKTKDVTCITTRWAGPEQMEQELRAALKPATPAPAGTPPPATASATPQSTTTVPSPAAGPARTACSRRAQAMANLAQRQRADKPLITRLIIAVARL